MDALLPEHPLSRLRLWFARLEPSLRLADSTPPASLILDEDPPAVRGPRQLLRAETIWHLYDSGRRHDLLKAALETEIAALGEEPTERLALCSLYLGCVESKAGRFLDALPPLRRAEAAYRAIGQDNTPAMAETKTHLGWALHRLGLPADALPQLRDAIRLFQSHPNDQLELLATSQAAALLAERGDARDKEELRGYAERTQTLFAKHPRRQQLPRQTIPSSQPVA